MGLGLIIGASVGAALGMGAGGAFATTLGGMLGIAIGGAVGGAALGELTDFASGNDDSIIAGLTSDDKEASPYSGGYLGGETSESADSLGDTSGETVAETTSAQSVGGSGTPIDAAGASQISGTQRGAYVSGGANTFGFTQQNQTNLLGA